MSADIMDEFYCDDDIEAIDHQDLNAKKGVNMNSFTREASNMNNNVDNNVDRSIDDNMDKSVNNIMHEFISNEAEEENINIPSSSQNNIDSNTKERRSNRELLQTGFRTGTAL